MSTSVLVGYATRYGSTQQVAEAIAETLRAAGLAVELKPLREVRSLDGLQVVWVKQSGKGVCVLFSGWGELWSWCNDM